MAEFEVLAVAQALDLLQTLPRHGLSAHRDR